jgi:hypothetical protein
MTQTHRVHILRMYDAHKAYWCRSEIAFTLKLCTHFLCYAQNVSGHNTHIALRSFGICYAMNVKQRRRPNTYYKLHTPYQNHAALSTKILNNVVSTLGINIYIILTHPHAKISHRTVSNLPSNVHYIMHPYQKQATHPYKNQH